MGSTGRGGGGGAWGRGPRCRLRTVGLLAWSFWGIGMCCVNVLVLHTVFPLIRIQTFFSIGVKKILDTIWYSCPCYKRLSSHNTGTILVFW